MENPTLYLFGGCNGAGKTTFAQAYLRQFSSPPRFLNADEIARGLSPLSPASMAVKAGRLLLQEVDACFRASDTFALESTLSGHTQVRILERARSLGYHIELHYLWIPSTTLAIRRIAQRVRKGGHHIPSEDVRRRYRRSLENFTHTYATLAHVWIVWDNTSRPARLLLQSQAATLPELTRLLCL